MLLHADKARIRCNHKGPACADGPSSESLFISFRSWLFLFLILSEFLDIGTTKMIIRDRPEHPTLRQYLTELAESLEQ